MKSRIKNKKKRLRTKRRRHNKVKLSGGNAKVCVLMSDNRDLTNDFSNAEYNSLVSAINYQYALKYGYDFRYYIPKIPSSHTITDNDSIQNSKHIVNSFNSLLGQYRSPSWSKLLSLWDALFKQYDTIIYIDSDCIFKRHEISIDDFINNGKYTKGDKNSEIKFIADYPETHLPCAGFMILNRSDNIKKFIKHWWNYNLPEKNKTDYYEQDALKAMIGKSDTSIVPVMGIIDEIQFWDVPGQFLRHVTSGIHNDRKPIFTAFYDNLYKKDTFTGIIDSIKKDCIINLDTIEVDKNLQANALN